MAIQQFVLPGRQLDLLGGALASTDIHRLFFALLPDATSREHLATLVDVFRSRHPELRARWVAPARYHATLHFLGDHAALPTDVVEAATAAAGRVVSTSFQWTPDTLVSFRGREPPCVLRGGETPAPLLQLWQTLGRELARVGQATHREREFIPHVTLGYGRTALAQPLVVEQARWPVHEFALIHHVVGQGAYQVLGRWQLDAA